MRATRLLSRVLRRHSYSGIFIDHSRYAFDAGSQPLTMPVRLHHLSSAHARPVKATTPDAIGVSDDAQLTVRVDTVDAAALRRVLHRALGDSIGVYVMKTDVQRGVTTLQLRTPHARVWTLMNIIMSALPRAEFGRVQPLASAAVH